tara:strand:- start:191 stop:292 length:102 start_codon:yes stop_codon:yes gene_type:complete
MFLSGIFKKIKNEATKRFDSYFKHFDFEKMKLD